MQVLFLLHILAGIGLVLLSCAGKLADISQLAGAENQDKAYASLCMQSMQQEQDMCVQ